MIKPILFFLGVFYCVSVFASETVNEQEYYAFLKQVKCVTCQNQSVADSYAPMALVMRKEIWHQFEVGKNQQDIKQMLIQRYGESIFFAPELKSKHIFIWIMPLIVLILGAFGFKRLLK